MRSEVEPCPVACKPETGSVDEDGQSREEKTKTSDHACRMEAGVDIRETKESDNSDNAEEEGEYHEDNYNRVNHFRFPVMSFAT